MEELLYQMLQLGGMFVMASIVAGIGLGMKYLRSKTKNDTLRGYLFDVERIVGNTVGAAMHTAVTGLKEKSADGKLTAEEGRLIRDNVIASVKAQAPDAALSMFARMNMDVDKFISTLVEKEVLTQKQASEIRELKN